MSFFFLVLLSTKENVQWCIVVYSTYTDTIHKRTLSFQTRTGLLISDFGPWRHEEGNTILKSLCLPYYADPTPTRGTSCDVQDLNSSLPVEIRKTQPHASTAENPIDAFLKSSGPSFLGRTSSTLQPHFLSGGFIMTNGDYHMLSARA